MIFTNHIGEHPGIALFDRTWCQVPRCRAITGSTAVITHSGSHNDWILFTMQNTPTPYFVFVSFFIVSYLLLAFLYSFLYVLASNEQRAEYALL